MEAKTKKDKKEEKFEWTAEVRETGIPMFEVTLPNYVTAILGLKDGDQVVFSETKNGEEMLMKKAKRE